MLILVVEALIVGIGKEDFGGGTAAMFLVTGVIVDLGVVEIGEGF